MDNIMKIIDIEGGAVTKSFHCIHTSYLKLNRNRLKYHSIRKILYNKEPIWDNW